jgi:hypothetical protein
MFRRCLILVLRYVDIPLSFLFVLWFVSGIAMIYVGGMAALSPEERLEHLPELDLSEVRLTPAEAASRALSDTPNRVTLLSVLRRPAYRVDRTTIFADDGTTLERLDRAAAQSVATRLVGTSENAVRFVRTVDRPDQWTLQLSRALPRVLASLSPAARRSRAVHHTIAHGDVSAYSSKKRSIDSSAVGRR